MLNLRQTSPGRGLDLAVWRQPGGPGPGGAVEPIVSMHGRGGPGHSRHWHHRNAQWLGTESQADRPWAGVGSSSFPSGIAQAPLTLHCVLTSDKDISTRARSLRTPERVSPPHTAILEISP